MRILIGLLLLKIVFSQSDSAVNEAAITTSECSMKFFASDTTFSLLDAEKAWNNLNPQQKLYAHHMARAAWAGQPIDFVQTSPESPLILILLHRLLSSKPNLTEVGNHLIEKHAFSAEDVKCLFIYSAAFFTFGGNYRNSGNQKFVPCVNQEKLTSAVRELLDDEEFRFFEMNCISRMYDYSKHLQQLTAFPPHGLTTYFSANCNETDAAIVSKFLTHMNMDAYNQRVFKTVSSSGQATYEIRLASSHPTEIDLETEEKTKDGKKLVGSQQEFEGSIFKFTRGDYGPLLGSVIAELKEAIPFSANDNQREMLKLFIQSFETGSLKAHKDATRYWIKDKSPSVESHLGFIECYRDPAGSRSSFEGFSAAVNKEESASLAKLVDGAPKLIQNFLPWPKGFETDRFLAPDFTALDVIAFAGETVYSGINLPNYDEIRKVEGFKNVHLINVQNAVGLSSYFLSEKDVDFLSRFGHKARSAQLIFHELLGHGSGKLLMENSDGSFNFDRNLTNPLTNQPVSSWYKPGETWNKQFGSISTTVEECRSEAVGLLLSTEPEALAFTGVLPDEAKNVSIAAWLSMGVRGLYGLKKLSDSGVWGSVYGRARFVILRYLMEHVPELFTIEKKVRKSDGQPDLLFTLNSDKLPEGKVALRKFLLHLQVYKSTADVKPLQEMYMKYSDANATTPGGISYLDLKKVVDSRIKEETVLVQPNTVLRNDGSVELIRYEASAEGAVKSFLERFGSNPQQLYSVLKELYIKDASHFPLPT